MAPFYGWCSTASRLEPLRGGSLLFTMTSMILKLLPGSFGISEPQKQMRLHIIQHSAEDFSIQRKREKIVHEKWIWEQPDEGTEGWQQTFNTFYGNKPFWGWLVCCIQIIGQRCCAWYYCLLFYHKLSLIIDFFPLPPLVETWNQLLNWIKKTSNHPFTTKCFIRWLL